ncbi:MAG: hypothetical protein AB1831_08330 [Pseudomonadota bacterium]
MVAAAAPRHAWCLAGPWYRWPRPGDPQDGRGSRPAIQKFAGDDFIAAFLAKPQHSLKYDPVIDVVNNYDLVSARSGMAGKLATFLKLDASGKPTTGPDVFRARLAPSDLRKLYQPTHDRHYLVTCELHCEAPGFPAVDRRQVCQAGFVVRRRRSVLPSGMDPQTVTEQAATSRRLEADLLELLNLEATAHDPQLDATLRANAAAKQASLARDAGAADWPTLLATRQAELSAERTRLHHWYDSHGIRVEVDGWFPHTESGKPSRTWGEWRHLADAAAQTADVTSGERTYPLFVLVPDPREQDHDAAGRTLYYGTVPTQDLAHDASGAARFDDQATYEVRCFVRAHHACPGRAGKTPDCTGPLTWSHSSEPYRVAAPFDVLGAANRPITIKMPDLRELAAQAASRPRGRLSPIRFVQPQQMKPKSGGMTASGGEMGGEAICSFSIPLITLIALFVLNLFLPIVVFLFQLWFLLVFRFCIPPSISASAGVDAALAVTPPGVDLDVDFAVKVGGVDQTADQLNALLGASLADTIRDGTGNGDPVDLGAFSNNALGPIDQAFGDAAALQPAADGTITPPPVGTPLVYETPVTPARRTAEARA